MATTLQSANAASTATIWADTMYEAAEFLTFWGAFEGPVGSDMPIVRYDDLETMGADNIKVDILLPLTSPGITGELASVEGNEEALTWRQMTVPVNDFANGVAWNFKAAAQINHPMRESASRQLSKWLAARFDDRIFTEATGIACFNGTSTGVAAGNTVIPTLNKFACGSATSRDTITDVDGAGRLGWNDLMDIKAYAQHDRKIEPLRVDGDNNEYFGIVLSDYALLSLKRNDAKWAQAQRDARVRSDTNPVFTGAAGMVDGVILYNSGRVPVYNNAGAVAVSDNVFFGKQFLSRAFNLMPSWVEEEFDYGRRLGISTTTIVGEKLNSFDLTAAGGASDANKTAIGSMVVYAASPTPSL